MIKKIGLLGGSFNPPHSGHLHLAQVARDTLALDEVWLLPVPQNTLKTAANMAPFAVRLEMCQALAADYNWLHAKDDEATIGTNETIDTVRHMQATYPHQFIWLMGADSFATVHDWGPSATFYNDMPTAVFGRTDAENNAALNSPTAAQVLPHDLDAFIKQPSSGWCFISMDNHPARATDIREQQPASAPVPHVSPAVKTIMTRENLYQST